MDKSDFFTVYVELGCGDSNWSLTQQAAAPGKEINATLSGLMEDRCRIPMGVVRDNCQIRGFNINSFNP